MRLQVRVYMKSMNTTGSPAPTCQLKCVNFLNKMNTNTFKNGKVRFRNAESCLKLMKNDLLA